MWIWSLKLNLRLKLNYQFLPQVRTHKPPMLSKIPCVGIMGSLVRLPAGVLLPVHSRHLRETDRGGEETSRESSAATQTLSSFFTFILPEGHFIWEIIFGRYRSSSLCFPSPLHFSAVRPPPYSCQWQENSFMGDQEPSFMFRWKEIRVAFFTG